MNKREQIIAELSEIDNETISFLQQSLVCINDLAKKIDYEMPKVEWIKREIQKHLVIIAPHAGSSG